VKACSGQLQGFARASPSSRAAPYQQTAAAQPWPLADRELDPNIWAYKPWWCQPFYILATGGGVVAGAWEVSGGSPNWAFAAAMPVAAWWYLFLWLVPAQFREAAKASNAELARRRRAAEATQPSQPQQQAVQQLVQQWQDRQAS
jgi:hypothetical protein